MPRTLQTTHLTREQHRAVLEAVRSESPLSENTKLFNLLTFQWSQGGALVHGEPQHVESLNKFLSGKGLRPHCPSAGC